MFLVLPVSDSGKEEEMKVVLKAEPKPGIQVGDLPVSKISPEDVLIRVKAVGICGSDVHIYEWTPGYESLAKYMPIVLGHEFSGEVVEVGKQVSEFCPGDPVTSETLQTCGRCIYCLSGRHTLCDQQRTLGRIGQEKHGAMAEYVACPGSLLHKIPGGVSFEEAAMVNPATVTLHALRRAEIFPGDPAVVLGAGPIGLILAQGVKAAGASPVIVTGLSQDRERLDLAKSLGADEVINVDLENPIEKVKAMTGGHGVVTAFEVSGSTKAFSQGLEMLRKGGSLIAVGIYPAEISLNATRNLVREMKSIRGVYGWLRSDWSRALDLIASGKIQVTPLITHRLSLERAEEGFEACLDRKALKVILSPG